MKRIVGMALVFLAGFFVVGCKGPSPAEPILKGEHKLRKMAERTGVSSRTSGGFFLFFGDFSGATKTTVSVKFAWEMNDGVYALSSLPLEKIRLKLDEKATTPTIKFRWRPCHYNSAEIQDLMNYCVFYAVVTVRESDWLVQVDLPLNQ